MLRRRSVIAILSLTVLLSGCGIDDTRAGFGVPTLDDDALRTLHDDAGVESQAFEGTLVILGNGCHTFEGEGPADGAWIVWPTGTDLVDGGGLRSADGTVFGDGAQLRGDGMAVTLADLPGGANPDSYFASFGGFCNAADRGVLVFESVVAAH